MGDTSTHGVPDRGIKYVLLCEIGMRGKYIKDGAFELFALTVMQMRKSFVINVSYEFGDNRFDFGIQSRLLAKGSQKLANCSVCALHTCTFLAKEWVVRVVQ